MDKNSSCHGMTCDHMEDHRKEGDDGLVYLYKKGEVTLTLRITRKLDKKSAWRYLCWALLLDSYKWK